MANTSEAAARILIDDQLRAAGWDTPDKSQVRTEVSVSAFGGVAVAGSGPDAVRTSDDYSLASSRSDLRAVNSYVSCHD